MVIYLISFIIIIIELLFYQFILVCRPVCRFFLWGRLILSLGQAYYFSKFSPEQAAGLKQRNTEGIRAYYLLQ